MTITIILLCLSVLSFYQVLKWDVNSDYRKDHIDHGKESILRVFVLVPTYFFLAFAAQTPWGLLSSFLLIAFSWWMLFDGWLNNKKRFNWWFTGSTDATEPDAHTDQFLKRLPVWGIITVKTLGLAASLVFYIYTLIH